MKKEDRLMYRVELHAEVMEQDLQKLPLEVLEEVYLYIEKYETNPYKYSIKLYDRGDLNLEGYRKTYIANATYRIVFSIENNIAKVVEIVAVGRRQNKEVYKTAFARITQGEQNGTTK